MVLVNQKFPSARAISYLEFPKYFVWDKTKREWKRRVKGHGTMTGRVYLKISNMNIYCCCLQKYVNKLMKIKMNPEVSFQRVF